MSVVALRRLFARQEDPYLGTDNVIAARIGGMLWMVMGVLTCAVAPIAPPTARIGSAGWAIAVAIALPALAGGRLLFRGRLQVEPAILFRLSFAGVTLVALLQWLAGPHHDSYHELYLPWALLTGALNPPRRLAAFIAALAVASCSFLIYDSFSWRGAGDMIIQLVMWAAIGVVASIYATSVRAQRAGLKQEGEDARRLARVDSLTGLGNRLALGEALGHEIARSERTGNPLSVLVIDVNGFKGINDRHGHLVGDECLRQVARAIQFSLREMDSAFRWGGDEFVVLLPETDLISADAARNRLRDGMAISCREPTGEPLSIGCGVAALEDGMTGDDLLCAADLALMGSKPRRSPRSADPVG